MRKFLSLCVAMMLMVGSMSATTIYCKVDKSWWKADGAAVAVHHWGGAEAATAWPGVRMTPVTGETDVWSYDVPADVDGLMFVRVNGEGAVADWGAKTANLTLPTDGKNLYTITSESPVWGDPGVAGVWSVYGEEPIPVVPAKYYITGDSALVDTLAWHPDAIKVMEDEYIFENLAAGEYKLKVTVNGDWATGKGYSDLTVKAEGLSTDNDNNVIFTLAEAGDVTVVYNDSVFTVSGEFYVAPVVSQYGLLVNGEFVPATKNDAYSGEGEEWVVNTTLEIGDEFQIYDNVNKAGWIIALDQFGYTNFTIDTEAQKYIVTENGSYAFYINLNYGNDKLYVGFTQDGTGIDNTDVSVPAMKIVRDGQIMIIKGDKIFNIQGQQLR